MRRDTKKKEEETCARFRWLAGLRFIEVCINAYLQHKLFPRLINITVPRTPAHLFFHSLARAKEAKEKERDTKERDTKKKRKIELSG